MRAKEDTFNESEFVRQGRDLVFRLTKAQQETANATGSQVLAERRVAMEQELDAPTPFTLNAFSLLRARGRQYAFAEGVRTDDVIPSKRAGLDSTAIIRGPVRGTFGPEEGLLEDGCT